MAKKLRQRKVSTPTLELLFSLVCDSVASDPNSGKPTLYGVFDKIQPDKLPARLTFHFFAKLLASRGNHQISIYLIGSDGKKQELGASNVQATETETEGIVLIHAAVSAELKNKGMYQVQIKSGRKKIGKACRFFVEPKKDKV